MLPASLLVAWQPHCNGTPGLLLFTRKWLRVHVIFVQLCCPCSGCTSTCPEPCFWKLCVSKVSATRNQSQIACMREHYLDSEADSDSASSLHLHRTYRTDVRVSIFSSSRLLRCYCRKYPHTSKQVTVNKVTTNQLSHIECFGGCPVGNPALVIAKRRENIQQETVMTGEQLHFI